MQPRHDLSSEEATLLYELIRIWEGRYRVNVDSDGLWSASRLTGAVTITAESGEKLRSLISQDAIEWNREVYARNNHA
jgi:hypothetical protein